MNFTKVQGAGNDFILIEGGETQRDWSRVAIAMCDRHFGVGSEAEVCGNGACAIAVLAQLHDYIDSKVDIKLQGRMLGVEWDGIGEVFLSGPAEIVFSGEWRDEGRL